MDVLGMEVGDLPDGWRPVNVVLAVECVDTNDNDTGASSMRLCTRANEELTSWAAIGILRAMEADLTSQYVGTLRDAGCEDEP